MILSFFSWFPFRILFYTEDSVFGFDNSVKSPPSRGFGLINFSSLTREMYIQKKKNVARCVVFFFIAINSWAIYF
jgi:hypothetical protein